MKSVLFRAKLQVQLLRQGGFSLALYHYTELYLTRQARGGPLGRQADCSAQDSEVQIAKRGKVKLGSLSDPLGPEEAPVVHRPGPGHLGEVG